MQKLQNFNFGAVNFDWFELNGQIFHAKGTTKTSTASARRKDQ